MLYRIKIKTSDSEFDIPGTFEADDEFKAIKLAEKKFKNTVEKFYRSGYYEIQAIKVREKD